MDKGCPEVIATWGQPFHVKLSAAADAPGPAEAAAAARERRWTQVTLAPITDHLKPGLAILFIGYNPSIRSGETGHHYANPNNRFYRILHGSGLTPRLYKPKEDGSLLELGYGFTNIVARPTATAAEITPAEYAEGRELLRRKIAEYRPRVACFVGKGVYEQYSGRRGMGWGAQPDPLVPGVVEYVCPSSSGLVRMKLDEMTDIFRGLLAYIRQPEG